MNDSGKLIVETNHSLLRDEHSKAIINTDMNALLSYNERRNQMAKEKERISNLENSVEQLKSELKETNDLLRNVLGFLSGKEKQ